jgi:UDP-N-acetyl-D-glucosamine dehydrogenase
MLVIIESTIQPGATREFVLPILKKVSGLNQDEFLLAFSPERIDPSNKKWGLRNTTKLVSGLSAEAALKAKEFYSQFVDDIKICSSVEVAETAKLLENAFRFINISFVNEMAFFCNKLGIEISEVIGAAATKPFGFMEFYPSIGIGGHCIPVDPMYLSSKASDINSPVSMIDLAEQINKSVPHYIVKRAKVILKDLEDKKILIIGVAYKPNVSDTRETPVLDLINILSSYGAKVYWHDELVKEWNGQKSNPLSKGYDLAIIASHHDYVNLALIGDTPVINTQNSIE